MGKGKSVSKKMASTPSTQVSSAKDAMGARDFLVMCVKAGKKVGSGAIRALGDKELSLASACVFVGSSGNAEECMWERSGLYMSVLPALKKRLRAHRIALSWVDWHHLTSSNTTNCPQEWLEARLGQNVRAPFAAASPHVQPCAWRCLEAIDKCSMPVPDGSRRPLALVLLGNSPDPPISTIDEYLLQERLPDVLPLPPPSDAAAEDAGDKAGMKSSAPMPSAGGQFAKRGMRAASVPTRPSLLEMVLARLGIGDKRGRRFVGRHLLFTGR